MGGGDRVRPALERLISRSVYTERHPVEGVEVGVLFRGYGPDRDARNSVGPCTGCEDRPKPWFLAWG